MTTDYTNCPRCGHVMKNLQMYVPAVTWNGKAVCETCVREIEEEAKKPRESLKGGK